MPSQSGASEEEISDHIALRKIQRYRDGRCQAAPLLEEDGIMVSIQNGLNNWEAIARQVGEARTVGARVIFGAEIPVPGHGQGNRQRR